MNRIVTGVLAVVVGVGLIGCGGSRKQIGSQRIVEKSPSAMPEWVQQTAYEKKDMLYYVGGVKNVVDYSLGLREAKAEGLKNLVESVKLRARTQLTQMTRGSNQTKEDLGKFIEDGVALTSTNLDVSGVLPREQYTEKIEETTGTGVKYLYNCYTLLGISTKDYAEARRKAIEGLGEQAKKENNLKAETDAKDLLKKLEAGE